MLIDLKPYLLLFVLFWIIFRIIKHIFKRKREIELFHEMILFLFFIYILAVINITLSPVVIGIETQSQYNFVPLTTIYSFICHSSLELSLRNIAGNVLLFIPLGLLLPFLWKKVDGIFKIMGVGGLFSCLIELVQLSGFFFRRELDIDDVILNLFGTLVGYIIYKCIHSSPFMDRN